MAGIYIHIPFCKQSCSYCNFHFSTSRRYQPEFVTALLKEIDLQKNYLAGEKVETIYLGGGTPSLLSGEEIRNILSRIKLQFEVDPDAEITLEANPDDIGSEILLAWKDNGINRLSMGVQSFFEEDLVWMNRAHNASQAIACLELATREFSNISIDLIYGTPQLTNEKWKFNVAKAIALGIPHLSCYALTVEPKTPLDKLIRLKQSPDVDPDKQAAQFLLLLQWMEAAGYEHYEISNFAKPGWRSRHNSSYWQGKKYVGLGPSAHSFNGHERQWNVANNKQYIDALQKGTLLFEKETLTATQQLNEYIMTALRTVEGIRFAVNTTITSDIQDALLKKAGPYIDSGMLAVESGSIRLTNKGKFLADGIAADLFF